MKPEDLFFIVLPIMEDINISHVAIYVEYGKVVEAVDENHGIVYGKFYNKGFVMIGRPTKNRKAENGTEI